MNTNDFYKTLVVNDNVRLIDGKALPLSIAAIHKANMLRQEEWDEGEDLDLLFMSNALCGEAGEFANVVKKLERARIGLRGSTTDLNALADEAADVLAYLEIACSKAGIDLGKAFVRKFNYVSEKHGLTTHIR